MKRLTLLLSALLCACGGGGGGEPSPVASGAPTYTVGGVITNSAGQPLAGVAIQLNGAAGASSTSDSTGAYLFVSLASGTYSVTPASTSGPFSPVSTPVSLQGQSVGGVNFAKAATVYASTQQIADYLASRHSRAMSSFNGSEAALSSTLAAQGGYYSGAHYTQSRNTLLATVQAFATDGLAFVQSNARTAAIDHAAVVALFNGYAAQDSVFSDSYYRAAGWGLSGTGLEGFITDTAALTTSIYAPLGQLIP